MFEFSLAPAPRPRPETGAFIPRGCCLFSQRSVKNILRFPKLLLQSLSGLHRWCVVSMYQHQATSLDIRVRLLNHKSSISSLQLAHASIVVHIIQSFRWKSAETLLRQLDFSISRKTNLSP